MAGEIGFDFISDRELREGLAGDHSEMLRCAEQEAWKAVYVLSGSIIEALLVAYLSAAPVAGGGKDPLEMTFGELIAAAKKAGALSQRSVELSGALKEYRNLIHPGRLKRLGETVDSDGALVAQALVTMIAREIASTQQKERGFTAEQIVNKVETDASALGIAAHLLSAVGEPELKRLLLEVLPARYFALLDEEGTELPALGRHERLFREAFDSASKEVKELVISRYVDVIQQDSGPRVEVYEEHFFLGGWLEFAREKDRSMLIDHMLERVRDAPNPDLLDAMQGIGRFLPADKIESFVDVVVRAIVYQSEQKVVRAARERLRGEYARTPRATDKKIANRLKEWREMFEGDGRDAHAKVVRDFEVVYGGTVPGEA